MRPCRLVTVLLFAALPLCAQDVDWKARLSAAISRAIGQNPEIAAMEARILASRHRVGQADALPALQLDLTLRDFPVKDFSLSRDNMTAEVVGLQQMFPAVGKRSARRAAAEAEVAGAEAAHEDHRIRLAAEVADVFFTLGEIDERVAITESSRERLRQSATSASERYRLGKGVLADVLRGNLDVTAAEERLAALRGERRAAAARWNVLQALPPSDPVAAVVLPAGDPESVGQAELIQRAEAASPTVSAARSDIRRAEEGISLARAEKRPDVTAVGYYAHRIDYESLAGLGVSLTLPFLQGGRLSDLRAEKEAELSGARANLEEVLNALRRKIAEAEADLDRFLEQTTLYRTSILPQAETNAQATKEAYMVGQVDFLTFSRAILDRDTYALELIVRRAGAWRALASLQSASGVALVPGTPAAEVEHE